MNRVSAPRSSRALLLAGAACTIHLYSMVCYVVRAIHTNTLNGGGEPGLLGCLAGSKPGYLASLALVLSFPKCSFTCRCY